MPRHVPLNYNNRVAFDQIVQPGHPAGQTPWILLSNEIDEEFTKSIIFELIPDGSGRGRFEITAAQERIILAENESPGSQPNVYPFIWTGSGIPANGNVIAPTQSEAIGLSAFRVVVESGAMYYNVRAV